MDDEMILVLITVPSVEVCRHISSTLLVKKLVACINFIPAIRSLYRWKGNIQDDEETLMICKTQSSLFTTICTEVQALHPYELPEIIAIPIQQGLPAYLEWIRNETQP